MKSIVYTSENVIRLVNDSTAQGNEVVLCPLSELAAVVAAVPDAFPERFAEDYTRDPAGALVCFRYSLVEESFDIEGVSRRTVLAMLFIRRASDTPVSVCVEALYHVVEIGGRYYYANRTTTKRYGLSLVGAAENVRGCKYEGQPNYFTTPSAKSLKAWAQWLTGCDAENAAEVAKVAQLHEQTRAAVVASGLKYSETSKGLTVHAGPVSIFVEFTKSGVYYRYAVNNGAIGYDAEAFTALLSMFGSKQEQTVQEQPKQEEPKRAYHVFKALAVETVDGVEQWTPQARGLMQRGDSCGNAAAADICRRALSGVTRLSERQRWCVAYALMRAM